MLSKVTASAPGKLMFTGSYAVVHGYPAIVTAVDQRLTVVVEKNGKDTFHLFAPDLGLNAYSKTIDDLGKKDLPKAVRFIEILYKKFLEKYPQSEGINVTTKSDFSSSFGFGSSSAVTVAFAKALTTLYGINYSDRELFQMCYETIIDVQGVGSGFDIAAAIWGGTLFYVSPAKVVETLKIDNLPLVVGYTGIKADTPTLVRMVNSKLNNNKQEIEKIFSASEKITNKLKNSLVAGDWVESGQLFNEHQSYMRDLGVSSLELENLVEASLSAGAMGATLSGAGGGDCMVALVDEEKRPLVEEAIKGAGGEVINVGLHAAGVSIER